MKRPRALGVAGGARQGCRGGRVRPRLDVNRPGEDSEASVCVKSLRAPRPRLAGREGQLLGSPPPLRLRWPPVGPYWKVIAFQLGRFLQRNFD